MGTIRPLTSDDLPEVLDLISYAFRWDAGERNRNRLAHLLRHTTAYGAFEDGKLASQIISLPFTAGFHGVRYQANGIGFVATYPEYRGRGHARDLMNHILRTEREQGTVLSYLAPFSYAFYRKFGYEQVFERFDVALAVGDWPDGKRVAGTVRRLDWLRAKDDVAAVYAAGEAGRPGALIREEWWETYKFHLRRDYQFAVYYDAEGLPRGYMAYQINGTAFSIFELEWLDAAAFQALSRFIRSHEPQFSLTWSCFNPRDLERMPLLDDPSRFTYRTVPYMMARLVNVKRFLEAYPFAGAADFALDVRVTPDASAPWNEGVYRVVRADGQVSVTHDAVTLAAGNAARPSGVAEAAAPEAASEEQAAGMPEAASRAEATTPATLVRPQRGPVRPQRGPQTTSVTGTTTPVLEISVQRLVQLLMGTASLERILASGGAEITGSANQQRSLRELIPSLVPEGKPAMEDYY